MAASPKLMAQLASITDSQDPEQLQLLGRVMSALSPESCGGEEFGALLAVLERFPLDDGFESFWSILHFLEACEGYEPYLIESVKRQPAELTLSMLNRLLNAGFTHCGEVSYLSMLQSAAMNPALAPELRKQAADFVEYQRERGSDA